MSRPVVILGRGRGLGVVLRALRGAVQEITVVVPVGADPADTNGDADPSAAQATLTELSRSLSMLAPDGAALSRALDRQLQIDRVGRRPLGALMLQSLTVAFGDLTQASEWLGEQLGVDGAVLPATDVPVQSTVVQRGGHPALRFHPADPPVSELVRTAIRTASAIVLVPGPPLESVLRAAAVPRIAASLARTRGRIAWIAEPSADPSAAIAHWLTLAQRHGVRVDTVLRVDRLALLRSAILDLIDTAPAGEPADPTTRS